ncbi:arginyl-tRNA synthetase [Hahella chejuensis KCTC 2396]|uniref:Arginine--tRNA ligase n=1 Tax=Hahella chejuensis (strain KCTC 2396) TaxID=349521 RepID=SYR_HAHCH|nr:arginine--tRNA ligase [Hahella chejuensis]Q2SMY0.1 RecName: Full=Arginine--tRNA ligase; AltName: Full=Arginyl-tRNA synthetase; Short=ArgRS [Hahella chejuensis KCTC 2396]ABC27994.1 arginyl-tRNA synthetase [Hahella chejuensis KCTC 2396]
MNLQQLLEQKISAALHAAGAPEGSPAIVKPSGKPQFGDYQANGVMGAAKALKMNPRELATKVLDVLDLGDMAEKVEIAGPGFINIFLSKDWMSQSLRQVLADPRLTIPLDSPKQTVVVDYSAPNLAKEMHVGHLRSTIIGDAVVRTLEFLGHRVIRQNHVGDWGTQFGMLLAYMNKLKAENQQTLSMELADLENFYRQAKTCFDEDPEFKDSARQYVVKLQSGDQECVSLWKTFIDISLQHCEDVYERLNVSLTRADVMPESAYNEDLPNVIDDLREKGLLTNSDGAECVFMDEFKGKDDETLPLIVKKSDGGYLYATTDLAALRYRERVLKANRVLYFVDARQSLHLNQVYAAGRKAGFVSPDMSLEHMAFGMVLGADGKPFKTRDGGTVKLADLLTEAQGRAYAVVKGKNPEMPEEELNRIAHVVGMAAVKYADLSKNRSSDYIFSFDAMLSLEGNTAPYVQYAYSRVVNVFKKGEVGNLTFEGDLQLAEPIERALAVRLLQFNEILHSVASEGCPHILCGYLYDLSKEFASFYEGCPVLKAEEPVRSSRLMLSLLIAKTLKQGLDLLGIETLERM